MNNAANTKGRILLIIARVVVYAILIFLSVLCLFSFYMLFALLLTWGESTSLSLLLMLFLLAVIYRQWLGLPWKKSVGRGVMTGVYYGLAYGLLILLVSGVVLLIAYLKAR